MKINEELYVSELAEILDIRTQSIYERLKKENNIINKYRVPDTDPVKLYKAVIEEVYKKDLKDLEQQENETLQSTLQGTEEEQNKNPLHENESKENYLKVIAVLEKQVEQQKKDLETKDKIILSITERLAESQNLVNQQQQLALADKKSMLELEEKIKLLEQPKDNIEEPQENKWSIFSIFKKKLKE